MLLKKPDELSFKAIRVWDHPDSVKLDANGKVKGKENKLTDGPSITGYLVGTVTDVSNVPEVWFLLDLLQRLTRVQPKKNTSKWRWTGKSLWKGKDGTVNVETRALEHYAETWGFKG